MKFEEHEIEMVLHYYAKNFMNLKTTFKLGHRPPHVTMEAKLPLI